MTAVSSDSAMRVRCLNVSSYAENSSALQQLFRHVPLFDHAIQDLACQSQPASQSLLEITALGLSSVASSVAPPRAGNTSSAATRGP